MQRYTIYLFPESTLHVSGWYLHPSSGAHTTVSTASSIRQTITATCRFRGGVGDWRINKYGALVEGNRTAGIQTCPSYGLPTTNHKRIDPRLTVQEASDRPS